MTDIMLDGSALAAEQAAQYRDRAEKMAAYRIQELAGSGAALGYLGTINKSRVERREKALHIAWDIYRDKGDHELVLRAAREISQFLDGTSQGNAA